MNPTRLLLAAGFAVRLWAGDEGAARDPFAAYRQAIDGRLSAMVQTGSVAQPAEVRENAPIAQSAGLDEIQKNEIVFARRFWGGREAELAAAVERLQRLRPGLETLLEGEGVPRSFVAVALIESGAQPLALSPRHARGLWQLIPETARRYGLAVNNQTDERVQVEAATRAAARYLRDLYAHFGDWPLAIAAYNAGQKAVDGALEKGRASTFWQLRSENLLPPETRRYVPAVLAAIDLLGSARAAAPAGQKARGDDWVYASSAAVN